MREKTAPMIWPTTQRSTKQQGILPSYAIYRMIPWACHTYTSCREFENMKSPYGTPM